MTGYDKKTVIKSIRSLINLSLVDRHKRYHNSAVYTIKAYIYPLYECGIAPQSNDNEGEVLPPSTGEGEFSSRELAPPKDNTILYKKELKREEKSPSRDFSRDRKLSMGQLKDVEKKKAVAEDQRIDTLPETAQRMLEEKADALLPPILQGKKFFIKVKMRELLENYSLDVDETLC